jgi:protein-disulfide isomerase
MSKRPWLVLVVALLCHLVSACAAAPPVSPPAPVAQVAVAAAPAPPDVETARVAEEVDDGDPGPIPVSGADPSWGRADALVTIVQFAEFQCPFCARAEQTLAELRRVYGPERLRIVWKHNPLPFHPNARPAAVAATALHQRLGNQGFWTAHEAFFANQKDLVEVIGATVERAGMAPGELQAPGIRRRAEAKVDADVELGKRAGVTGTPAFFLNGVFVSGAQPFEKFAPIVDEQIQRAQALVAQGTPRRRVYAELAKAQWKPAEPRPADTTPKEDDRLVHRVPVAGSPVRGNAAALVTIVEFADFQCPFCGRVEATLQQVLAHYGDKVRLVWKHNPLPFHLRSEPAAELAVEARAQKGDRGFWAAHDLLFARQCKGEPDVIDKSTCESRNGRWIDNQQNLADADLLDYASAIGLDGARVSAAIAGKKHRAVIEAEEDLADDAHATGTPHFFINGRRFLGAQPLERFKAIIDEELAKAEALVKGGLPAAQVYERIQAAATPPPAPEKKSVPAPTRDNPGRGPAGARVVVQFFGDFQCQFCKRANATIEELEKTFPGKLRIVWRNRPLPTHHEAEPAAEAAMEAFKQRGDKGFWAMHALLYAAQGQPGALERPALDRYAVELGLDPVRFAHALDGQAHKGVIEADGKIATDAGINGTPGFVINGYFVSGAQPLAKFVKIVRRALAGK